MRGLDALRRRARRVWLCWVGWRRRGLARGGGGSGYSGLVGCWASWVWSRAMGKSFAGRGRPALPPSGGEGVGRRLRPCKVHASLCEGRVSVGAHDIVARRLTADTLGSLALHRGDSLAGQAE